MVHVSITPFGRTGPYAEFAATEIVLHAMSGEMKLTGLADMPPLQKGGHFAQIHGGLHGYVAAMAALIAGRCRNTAAARNPALRARRLRRWGTPSSVVT